MSLVTLASTPLTSVTLASSPTNVVSISSEPAKFITLNSVSGAVHNPNVVLSTHVTVAKRQDTDAVFTLAAGSEGNFTADGISGKGVITIQGTYVASTLSSGVQTGIAGAASNSTTLNKPTGAANWTTNNLRGKYLRITAGGGAGAAVRIRSNTTTAITCWPIVGLTSGSTFEIVDAASILSTVTLTRNAAKFKFVGVKITRLVNDSNTEIECDGCHFNTPNVNGSVLTQNDNVVRINNCYVDAAASVIIQAAKRVEFDSNVMDTGKVKFESCVKVDTDVDAKGGASTPVWFFSCQSIDAGCAVSNATGDGIKFESCMRAEQAGVGWVGSGNTGYGVRVEGGGYVNGTGATITGNLNDLICVDVATSWSTLASSYVQIIAAGTHITA